MRKSYLALAAIFAIGVFGNSAKAQNEVKLNFLGFIFGNYGIIYENILSEQMGAGASFNYYSYSAGDDKWSGWNIAPEFRFYFSPDDDGEGLFAGPYLKYRSAKLTGVGYYDQDNNYKETDRTASGLALGIGFGRKWVSDAGFLFETYAGIGKYLVEGEKYGDDAAEEYYEELDDEISGLSSIDLRLGLTVGWRF